MTNQRHTHDGDPLTFSLLHAALDREPVAVAIFELVGEDFVYLYANNALRAFKPSVLMTGQRLSDVWPELAGAVHEPMRRVYDTGEAWVARDTPFDVETQPGVRERRWFTFEVSRLESGGRFLLQAASDVTAEYSARKSLEEKDQAIRAAYSDVIGAVTGGRLVILGRDEMQPYLEDVAPVELDDASRLGFARARVRDEVGDVRDADELLVAFSEAATNMLKHAGGGSYWVRRADDRVQIVLSDNGHGIDFRNLPKATLTAGFSTAQTLGLGFTLMMELCDRLLLCSDEGGTVLILERDLVTSRSLGGALHTEVHR